MSLVGRRIKKWSGEEATVREVALDPSTAGSFYALVRLDDGRLESWNIYQCTEIEHKPAPYTRPPPTAMPGPGARGS